MWEGPRDVVESAGFQVTNEGTHLFRVVPFIMTVPSWDEIMQCILGSLGVLGDVMGKERGGTQQGGHELNC